MTIAKKFNELTVRQPPTLFAVELFLLAGVLAVVVWRGPQFAPDTSGYLDFNVIRPPFYTLFIKAISLVSGAAFAWAIVIVQFVLIAVAIIFFSNKLSRVFALSPFQLFLVRLVLFVVPVAYPLHIANFVLTEGLAYPLFLIAFGFLLKFIRTGKTTDFGLFLVASGCAALTRSQFAILFAIAALTALADFWRRQSPATAIYQVALVVAAFVVTTGAGRLANLIHSGHFVSAAHGRISFAIMPLYVAEDRKYDLDPVQAQVFAHIHAAMRERGLLLAKAAPRDPTPQTLSTLAYIPPGNGAPLKARIPVEVAVPALVWTGYNEILFSIIPRAIDSVAGPSSAPARPALTIVEGADVMVGIAQQIIRENPLRYAMVVALVAVDGFGGRAPCALFLILCLLTAGVYLYAASDAAFAASAVLAAHGANICGFSLGGGMEFRYTFYTGLLVVVLLGIAVMRLAAIPKAPPPSLSQPG